MPTVYFQTFGCQMNVADSSELGYSLASRGFAATDDPHEADLIVVNTCSVREHAEARARARIAEYAAIKRSRKTTRVWVIGCMAERLGKQLKIDIPGIDAVIGAPELADPEAVVEKYLRSSDDAHPAAPGAAGVSEFVPIMRGCNNFCAYCIVPYVRGREQSIPQAAIMDAIQSKVDRGVREVTLLGQNVNSYHDGQSDFSDLLARVAAESGLARVRFTTSHPKDCTEKLIRTIADHPTLCRHIHLPVQSGSNRILSLMNRGYTVEHYQALIAMIRTHLPDVDLTTDLLVGFPSETEEEFEETLLLAKSVRYTTAFMFAYSVRQGTAAAALEDTVPRTEKIERLNRLIALQTSITKEIYQSMVTKTLPVMVYDEQKKKGETFLRGQDFGCKRVLISCTGVVAGTILTVNACKSSGMTLIAERK